MVTMFAITLVSEVVNDRSFVSMAEDLWTLPFLIAIYTLPAKPNEWMFFVRPDFRHCDLSKNALGPCQWLVIISVSA